MKQQYSKEILHKRSRALLNPNSFFVSVLLIDIRFELTDLIS